jgi:hypothetical protein
MIRFNFLNKNKNKPGLKELLTKEEFLRFTIIQKEISLEKLKTELKNFLKKNEKKKK